MCEKWQPKRYAIIPICKILKYPEQSPVLFSLADSILSAWSVVKSGQRPSGLCTADECMETSGKAAPGQEDKDREDNDQRTRGQEDKAES